MNIFFNPHANTSQMKSTNNPRTQAISEGINKLLLQNVKIGDLLSVEIISNLQKQIKGVLADGTIFEAQLDHPLDLNIGQQVTFQVKDIIGRQVQMEIVVEGDQRLQEGMVDIKNILKQLDIPVSPESQEAVKFLMQKMLPLSKENIKQMEFGLKASQLPIDSLLSMLENEIPMTPTTLKQMQAYENGEIKLQGQLEAMANNIVSSDDPVFLEEAHKLLSLAKGQIDQLGHNQPKEANFLDGKAQISGQSQDKESAEPNKVIVPKDLEFSKEPLLSKELSVLKKEIRELFKESFFIDPSQLKDRSETKFQKINELYKEIYKVADQLEKLEEKLPQEQKTLLYSDIKSNIEFLTIANKYDTMIHIPLVIQNQYKHGELYIFNKKKKGKKSYNEASMLLSLETVSLGTVEAYIRKYNKQISVQFKTDSEPIENIIKDRIQLLKSKLKDKDYDLTSVTYIPNTQVFLVKEERPSETGVERYRFDTKA